MAYGLADPNYIQRVYGAIPATARVGVGPYAFGGNVAPTTLRTPASRYPTYTAGPLGQRVPYDPSLYAKKKPTVATRKPAAGGIPSIDSLIQQIYGTIETPAQQEARVNREINAQIAAQQKLMDDEYAKQRADALASFQAQSLAGQAAAAMNKDLFGAVGGEFNAAAGEMKGLAHGLSKNAQGATAGDVSRANAALGALGNAPVTEGGTFGVGGGTQQGVEEYRGGTLAQQMFGAQGEAANFGLAGMIGSQALEATQTAQAALIKTERDINDSHAKAIDSLASGRLDLYHQYMADAKDSRLKQITLVQGLIAQKQATAASAAKLKQQAVRDMLAQANRDRTFGLQTVKERRMQQSQQFGQAATKVRLNQADTRIGLSKAQLQIALEREQRQVAAAAMAAGQVDVNKSKALGHVVDKAGRPVTDSQGRWIPSKALAGKKAPTAETVAKAGNMIQEWFYGYKSVPSSSAKGAPLKRIPAYKAPGFDPNDSRTWGKGFSTYPKALSQLTRMGFDRTQARNMLNEYWERGDHGRPIFSTEEQNAIRQKFGRKEYERMVVAIRRALDRGSEQQADAWIAQVLSGQPFNPGYTGYGGSPAG